MSDGSDDWMGKALEAESQKDYLKKQVEMLSRSNFDKVREFHVRFSLTQDPDKPTQLSEEDKIFRIRLISEEFQEVVKELGYEAEFTFTPIGDPKDDVDLPRLAKELADLLVVVYGTAARYGINMDEVFDAVHEGNMSKADAAGRPVYREDGKIMKGDQYKEPDVAKVLKKKTRKRTST